VGTPPDDGAGFVALLLIVLLLALLAVAVPFAVASNDVIVSGEVHAVLLTVGAVAVLTPSDDTTALAVDVDVVGSAIPCCGLAILRGLDGGVFMPCSVVNVMLYLLIVVFFMG